ncbi:heterokaryon incompatibility protein-domain-containing protein, partial [Lasiosphaeria miniovina]
EPLIRYSYQPLPSKDRIRLLHLDPSDDRTAPITITISEHRLSEAPTYDALSYAWGDVDDMHDIVALDGSTARRVLPVTKNCHSALRRLRLPDSQRALWVDAVCINQDDISERNAQVALMGGIYRDATRVVVDVGETSDSSDAAIDFIARYSRDPGTGTILFNMTGGLGIRSAIGDFYRRPWFTRVWVLQEVFMARRETAQLLCGDRLVDWAVFRPFKIWVDSRPAWETEHWHVALPTLVPQSLVIGNRHGRQHSGGQDFLALLCKVRSCLSTDPRDKVFALLSMFDFGPDDKDRIVADYGKSAAQVYVEAAAWLLPRVGLAFLSC